MTHRKPYIREMNATWWQKHAFYRLYMLREATVLPLIFFTLSLLFGLGCLMKGPEAWQSWLNYMANPIIMIIHVIALAGSLFHAGTFFSMMPQVVPIRLRGKLIHKKTIVLAQWCLVTAISLIVLITI
ncbi:Fumarate reductase subunit C [Vibrio aerogenes CECT 7868]|uniref:Fumarate reductase subunit C n=1 Tax=Vibrio aerogenes CECT 7868 TaxID=1216006 RepID=A0A1M5ZL61_9VIBR|nr:fumarate reductase subunit FrdC [Vibrio aerogenes]SHI25085.1 Fumarate reductase subunit C [Vibrio aerogenes CECT 7868]